MLNIMVTAEHLTKMLEQRCGEFGITLSQYNVLRILRGVHPKGHARFDIIDRMLHLAPDVTRLIDKLADAGLVKRDRSADDGRLSITFITPKGIALLNTMVDSVNSVEASLVSRLSEQDARFISQLCEKVYGVDRE